MIIGGSRFDFVIKVRITRPGGQSVTLSAWELEDALADEDLAPEKREEYTLAWEFLNELLEAAAEIKSRHPK